MFWKSRKDGGHPSNGQARRREDAVGVAPPGTLALLVYVPGNVLRTPHVLTVAFCCARPSHVRICVAFIHCIHRWVALRYEFSGLCPVSHPRVRAWHAPTFPYSGSMLACRGFFMPHFVVNRRQSRINEQSSAIDRLPPLIRPFFPLSSAPHHHHHLLLLLLQPSTPSLCTSGTYASWNVPSPQP